MTTVSKSIRKQIVHLYEMIGKAGSIGNQFGLTSDEVRQILAEETGRTDLLPKEPKSRAKKPTAKAPSKKLAP